jgi:GTPase SAR1 family protein
MFGTQVRGHTAHPFSFSHTFMVAGQEKFHSLVPLYFRKASAVLVVYDITRQKTYEDAKMWVRELKNQAPDNVIIALAGNKLDLAQLRDIETIEAQQYASEIGAIFGETSAKDSSGIRNIFEQIGNTFLGRMEGRNKPDQHYDDDNSPTVLDRNTMPPNNTGSGTGKPCCSK